jgi:Transposase
LHLLDRFHITGHINKAVDEVRRAESTRLRAKSKSAAAPKQLDESSRQPYESGQHPVTPLPQLLLQNYLTPSPEGCHGRAADEELLRLYWPLMMSGVQNIFQIYQPLFTELLFSARHGYGTWRYHRIRPGSP